MSIICIVCRDALTEGQGEAEPRGAEAYPVQPQGMVEIVATKCGHLYHFHCLIGWFNTQTTQGRVVGECPYCKTLINGPPDYIKIFPSGDEETDAVLAANSQAALLRRRQSIDMQDELRVAQMRLEEESLNHDILKCEHSEALGAVERIRLEKEKLEESMNLKEAGHSLKCEALTGQVTSLDAQVMELTIITETLRNKNEELESTLLELTEQFEQTKISLADISVRQAAEDSVHKACQTEYEDMDELKSRVAAFDNCLEFMAKEKKKLENLFVGRNARIETIDLADPEIRDISIPTIDDSLNDGQSESGDVGLEVTVSSINQSMTMSIISDTDGDGSSNSTSSVHTSPDAQRKDRNSENPVFVDCSSDAGDDDSSDLEELSNPPAGVGIPAPNFVIYDGQRKRLNV